MSSTYARRRNGNTMGSLATEKQIDYILSLAECKYLSQLYSLHGIPLTQREKSGGMTKAEASAIIDRLKAKQRA